MRHLWRAPLQMFLLPLGVVCPARRRLLVLRARPTHARGSSRSSTLRRAVAARATGAPRTQPRRLTAPPTREPGPDSLDRLSPPRPAGRRGRDRSTSPRGCLHLDRGRPPGVRSCYSGPRLHPHYAYPPWVGRRVPRGPLIGWIRSASLPPRIRLPVGARITVTPPGGSHRRRRRGSRSGRR